MSELTAAIPVEEAVSTFSPQVTTEITEAHQQSKVTDLLNKPNNEDLAVQINTAEAVTNNQERLESELKSIRETRREEPVEIVAADFELPMGNSVHPGRNAVVEATNLDEELHARNNPDSALFNLDSPGQREVAAVVESVVENVAAKSESMKKAAERSACQKMEQDESVKEEHTDAVADVIAAMELSGTSTIMVPKPTGSGRKKAKNRSAAAAASQAAKQEALASANSSANADMTFDAATGKRRKKDPSAPKAPLNGYLVFFNKERTEMHQRSPQIGFGELTKIIANKWKELPTEEKQRYTYEAELDKERYVKEMADYKKSDSYKLYLKGESYQKLSYFNDLLIVAQQYNI